MSDFADQQLESNRFHEAPRLFRWGPWALFVFCSLFCAASVIAGFWRVNEGRSAEYIKTFQTVSAAAHSATLGLEEMLDRLEGMAQLVESHQDSPQELNILFNRHLVAEGSGTQTVALAGDGRLIGSTEESLRQVFPELAKAAVKQVGLVSSRTTLLPSIFVDAYHTDFLPVVCAVGHHGAHTHQVSHVVFFVTKDQVARFAQAAFGTRAGWASVSNAKGLPVLDIAANSEANTYNVHHVASRLDQAMSESLDWTSRRLLTADSRGSGRFTLRAGIPEYAALAEFKHRVDATWLIIAFALLPLTGLCLLFGYALRKFSTVEAYLRRLATIDVLTGLPNRRSFNSLLSEAVHKVRVRGSTMALLFIDLDDFKYVNDSQGHELGDHLLRHVARTLREVVHAHDHVCRLAGDEFTVIATSIANREQALELGEQILDRLKDPTIVNGFMLKPRASIGIALMPEHGRSGSDLMRFADTAMYEAKRGGKGRCIAYDQAMASRAQDHIHTARELEAGIQRGELSLVYQPKFGLADGHLDGFEALVRWNHPTRGFLSPGIFIPLAEETGLIAELGAWVLEHTIAQLSAWAKVGIRHQRIAVNVSPLQLRDSKFADYIADLLTRYAVPGSCLQIEITESAVTENPITAQALVRKVRELGVTVALDDFGTGYSSLASLQEFEFDLLKVDRSFINRIHTPNGLAVCRAVVRLGHALGMTVIAEGVETEDQARALKMLRCDLVQGFLYAKPLPPDTAQAVAVKAMKDFEASSSFETA